MYRCKVCGSGDPNWHIGPTHSHENDEKIEIVIPPGATGDFQIAVAFDTSPVIPGLGWKPLFKAIVPPGAQECVIWLIEKRQISHVTSQAMALMSSLFPKLSKKDKIQLFRLLRRLDTNPELVVKNVRKWLAEITL